jgi:hypothetical protein
VIFYFYVVPELLDFAFWTDQERAAHDALERTAHELFHAPGAVGFDHFVIGIAEQGEIEFLLGAEFGEVFFRVGAGTEDQHAAFVEGFLCVTKLGRFCRSTGSVGFREEKEDHASSAKIREG